MKVLKVIKGSNKGEQFSLKDGLILGSLKGDIVIGEEEDVENALARVEIIRGDIFLKSEGSLENIFCDGELVSHIVLKPGVQFRLETTHFEVQELVGEFTGEYLLDGTAEIDFSKSDVSINEEETESAKEASRTDIESQEEEEESDEEEERVPKIYLDIEEENEEENDDRTESSVEDKEKFFKGDLENEDNDESEDSDDNEEKNETEEEGGVESDDEDEEKVSKISLGGEEDSEEEEEDLESEDEDENEEEEKKEEMFDLSKVHVFSVKEENQKNLLLNELWKVEDENKDLQFLKQPIYLKFEKGLQKGLCWEIAYLPRKIGSVDGDLPLLYHQIQNVNFQLDLQGDKVIFSTDQPEIFLVNYKPTEQIELKNNDLIIIGASYIRFLTENTNKP